MGCHIALVLPGGAAGPYTAPLLVPSLAVEETGAQVKVVPYPEFRPQGLERAEALEFDAFVSERVVEILAEGSPSKVTFIAKSRGALFLSTMGEVPLPADVDAIWVTPLLGLDYVRDGVTGKRWPSLLVAGTADPYHDPAAHAKVCETIGAESLVVDGADHGLVVRGSVGATVEGFRALAEASLAFAARRT
jgi:pimeloyl-ACP methyl ester carboxylesterase